MPTKHTKFTKVFVYYIIIINTHNIFKIMNLDYVVPVHKL